MSFEYYKKTFLCVCLVLCVSCGGTSENLVEVSRISSPDKKVDAVLLSGSINATTSEVFKLYIAPIGEKVDDLKPVMKGDHFVNFSMEWRKDKFLDVIYKEGRVFSYSNFWQSKDMDDYSYVVEVRLNPPADFSLSDRDRWVDMSAK